MYMFQADRYIFNCNYTNAVADATISQQVLDLQVKERMHLVYIKDLTAVISHGKLITNLRRFNQACTSRQPAFRFVGP